MALVFVMTCVACVILGMLLAFAALYMARYLLGEEKKPEKKMIVEENKKPPVEVQETAGGEDELSGSTEVLKHMEEDEAVVEKAAE
jgi:predicted membrane protein